ncbi:MAG: carbohydrate binding family 9 domain-containing protein, partial [Candidatus Aminicenantes bacterium]|nr:carbohydrate binding family 9 domain-containing protein [Candidatus Aminicenantes bacterium]
MRKNIALLVSFSILLLLSNAFGQWRLKQTAAKKITEPIVIDGVIDEAAWRGAPEVSDFIQFQPRRGELAQFRMIVKIAYDESCVYFGFFCYDSQPEAIAARLVKRDSDLRPDDSVYVFLDTFNDKQSSYFFGSNLLGTQWDGRFTDNGRTADDTWDGVWRSAAQKTDFGWSAEIAISLTSIKYEPGENKTWGLSLGRSVPRILEHSFWTGPLESTQKVSQFGELTGLELAAVLKKSQIIPHVILKV